MALMVSVSGVRGLVGESLTPTLVLEFAQAFGSLLDGGRVVLARDTRNSGEMYAAAAAAGLLASGCRVTQLGVAMTPTVGRAIRTGGYAGGLSITASHNPVEWNGVKFFNDLGIAPDPQFVAQINEAKEKGRLRLRDRGYPVLEADDSAGAKHVEAVLEVVETDMSPLKGQKVVLDSINGAGALHTPALLAALGCELIHLNAEPNGEFAHRPEPVKDNLQQLCNAVREHGARVGFAQDPDADRLAVVDENGDYIGEEYTLALAAEAVLSRRRGPVAVNLSTSRMIDDVARQHGVPVYRTPVGEAHVARAMLANECVVGGEGNGGVIDPRICLVRDSLTAISQVLQLMAATGRRVSQLVESLPRYVVVKEKAECPRERIEKAVAAVTEAFADRQPNTADGVRIDFPEGWVHLRGSNTEPIMRLIAEAANADTAYGLVRRVRQAAGF